jgi:hypothetical protein
MREVSKMMGSPKHPRRDRKKGRIQKEKRESKSN